MKHGIISLSVFFLLIILFLPFARAPSEADPTAAPDTSAANDQPPYLNNDGSVNFDNPADVASALNSGKVSVDQLLQSNPSDSQLETVFLEANPSKQSEIIGKKFGTDVSVKGKITGIKGGSISTAKVSSFDLNEQKGFLGTITVNDDGTITLSADNQKESVKVGGESIDIGMKSSLRVEDGKLTGHGIIEHNGAKVESGNDFIIYFDSDKHSEENYVQFNGPRLTVSGNDMRITVDKASSMKSASIEGGNNIRLVNGEMTLLYKDNEIIQEAPFGMAAKDFVVYDQKNLIDFSMYTNQAILNKKELSESINLVEFTKGKQVGTSVDVNNDNRVIVSMTEVELSNTKVKALNIQFWTFADGKLTDKFSEGISKAYEVLDKDVASGTISSKEADVIKEDVGKLNQWMTDSKKYTANNGEKYNFGESNFILTQYGKAALIPRIGCVSGKMWGNKVGEPDPSITGPSIQVSPQTALYVSKQISGAYVTEEGIPLIPSFEDIKKRQ